VPSLFCEPPERSAAVADLNVLNKIVL
jgi:hypothetical protein